MDKITELTPVYVETISKELEEGKLYISEEFKLAIHLCACGCKEKTVMPFGDRGWVLTKHDDNTVSFSPSIGNFSGENPYHAHYFIQHNKIVWA